MNYEADKAAEKPIARGIKQAAEQSDGAAAVAGLVAALQQVAAEHLLKHHPHSPRYLQEVMLLAGPMQDAAKPFDTELVCLRARVVELERAMACYAQKSASAVGMPDAAWSWEQHWNDMVKHFRDILKKEQK